MHDHENDRDGQGRFRPGNAAARGNIGSRERSRLGRALRAVVDEDAIQTIALDLRTIASDAKAELGARIAAMRLLLEHSVGRPRESEPDAVPLALPSLRSPAAIVEGIASVFDALQRGDLNVTDAAKLVDTITKVGDAVAWRDVEARIAALERARGIR